MSDAPAATQAPVTPVVPTTPVTPQAPATPTAPTSHSEDMVYKDQAAVDRAIGQRLEQERNKLETKHAAEIQKAKDDAKAEVLNEVRLERVSDKTMSIAESLKFHDPKDALAVIDKDKLPVDKDGKPDADAIKKALEDLLTAKSYLAASDEAPVRKSTAGRPKLPTGNSAEGDDKGKKVSAAEALRKLAAQKHR